MLAATLRQGSLSRPRYVVGGWEYAATHASSSENRRRTSDVCTTFLIGTRQLTLGAVRKAQHSTESVEGASHSSDDVTAFTYTTPLVQTLKERRLERERDAGHNKGDAAAVAPQQIARMKRKELRAALRNKSKEDKLRARRLRAVVKLQNAKEILANVNKAEAATKRETRHAEPEQAVKDMRKSPSRFESFLRRLMGSAQNHTAAAQPAQASETGKAAATTTTTTKQEATPQRTTRIDFHGRDHRTRESKAIKNAQMVGEGRRRRQEAAQPEEQKPSTKLVDLPGTGIGTKITYLDFEAVEMRYPPDNVYPPEIPKLGDEDLVFAARVFAVHRHADVEWASSRDDQPGYWRRTMRQLAYYESRGMFDFLDGEQQFEYIGDSVLHLVSRSVLMTRFPRRASYAYNIGSNFLVSNDVFGHIYDDAKLEDERQRIWSLLQAANMERELAQAAAAGVSEAEIQERREAPLPSFDLPITHQRKADLFEAYTGAVYLTSGFSKAARWTTHLFEPWVDRIARTPRYQSAATLTAAGQAQRKAQREAERKSQEQHLQQSLGGMGTAQRLVRSALMSVLPQRLFPELRNEPAQAPEPNQERDERAPPHLR